MSDLDDLEQAVGEALILGNSIEDLTSSLARFQEAVKIAELNP